MSGRGEVQKGFGRRRFDHDTAARRAKTMAWAIAVAILLAGMTASPLSAQTYPNRPIRFIFPFPPGGPTDILGRIIGQKLAERLGQPVVPENKPGAGANIGLEIGAKAKPDGYTITLASPSLSISPTLYKKLNYDSVKDFAPISLVAEIPNVLLVPSSSPIKSLRELIAIRQGQPRQTQLRLGRHRHLEPSRQRALKNPRPDQHRPRAVQRVEPGDDRHDGRRGGHGRGRYSAVAGDRSRPARSGRLRC